MLFKAVLALLVGLALGSKPCPPEAKVNRQSQTGSQQVEITMKSKINTDVEMFWVKAGKELDERPNGYLAAGNDITINSYPGHRFLFRTSKAAGSLLVMDFVVGEGAKQTFEVLACGDIEEFEERRIEDLDFRHLVHDNAAPCVGEDSKDWSCVRFVSEEEKEARAQGDYGFIAGEGSGENGDFGKVGRYIGQTIDTGYTKHIPKIPKLTKGLGLLKMDMPEPMRSAVLGFYEREKDKMNKHEVIGGFYTNNHVVSMDKLNLDFHKSIHADVIAGMVDVEQWWTQRFLKHTSTFGIRIYRKDAMLINHVDRADTHLASAVIQVSQECEKEGWPLEVIADTGALFEVYLQPGEMVLYEGARLFHGRPMRSNCTEFANIFSHFAPVGYNGPHRAPEDTYEYREPAEQFLFDEDARAIRAEFVAKEALKHGEL